MARGVTGVVVRGRGFGEGRNRGFGEGRDRGCGEGQGRRPTSPSTHMRLPMCEVKAACVWGVWGGMHNMYWQASCV
eukprot:365126-Chlamydomonas_euryale.AAC.21